MKKLTLLALLLISPVFAINYNESTMIHAIDLAFEAGESTQASENALDLATKKYIDYDSYISVKENCEDDIEKYNAFIASPALKTDKTTYNESTLAMACEKAFKAGKADTLANNILDRYSSKLVTRDQLSNTRKHCNEDITAYNEFIKSVLSPEIAETMMETTYPEFAATN